MSLSIQTIYDNLTQLENGDVTKSALYRQLAQEVLADPKISLSWRQAIAERLTQANLRLANQTVETGDSY
jgi:hypothetical protein